jgi:hypothetical protein
VFRTIIVIAMVAAVAALIATYSSASDSPALQTYQGRTAQTWARAAHGWQRTAVKRSQLGDWLQTRLTARVREVNSLHRTVRRIAAHDTVLTSPQERNFLCIHSYEGSWVDPNPPYYGGVQMDEQFAKTYGREFWDHYGTPDHWPASVQIAVAIKASFTRGYYPWPNTARHCGLL